MADAPDEANLPLLSAHNIVKRWGDFAALDGVDFAVRAGEIHALLGENGAGKSTLMNLLSGLLRPTSGAIRRDGTLVQFRSPSDAERAGIGMVHQHFLLVPTLTIRENLLLGAARAQGGPLSYPVRAVVDEAKALANRLGWSLPWDALAGDLPVGTQQRLEILKALRGDTRVLIFDEPTAVLTPTETPELFATLRKLASEGRGIVFISHKLAEVLELSHRVTVLRRGRVVYTARTVDTDREMLASAMVGAESEAASLLTLQEATPVSTSSTSDENGDGTGAFPLHVSGLRVDGERSAKPRLSDIGFAVRSGEIFGIAGVDGNGQDVLAECLVGLRRPTAGRIEVVGHPPAPDAGAFRRARVASIPADRQTRGLMLPLTLTENMALGVYDKPEFRCGPLLRWKRLQERTAELIRHFDIRAGGPHSAARALSGGNQQKVVIARALADSPRVIVAVNPTRGLDVGAIAFVYRALRQAQADGAAIVLISTELDEVRTLSDRVAVLYDGSFNGIVPPSTPRETFGLLMGGAQTGETRP